TGTGATPSHAYADNGAYTVTLTVTDAKGAASAPASATATVTNVVPAVSVPASLSATAGTPLTLAATFSDPGAADTPWAYSINWGDGDGDRQGRRGRHGADHHHGRPAGLERHAGGGRQHRALRP